MSIGSYPAYWFPIRPGSQLSVPSRPVRNRASQFEKSNVSAPPKIPSHLASSLSAHSFTWKSKNAPNSAHFATVCDAKQHPSLHPRTFREDAAFESFGQEMGRESILARSDDPRYAIKSDERRRPSLSPMTAPLPHGQMP
jgi:hypothetical protein